MRNVQKTFGPAFLQIPLTSGGGKQKAIVKEGPVHGLFDTGLKASVTKVDGVTSIILHANDDPALLGNIVGRAGVNGAELDGPSSWQIPNDLYGKPLATFRQQTGQAQAELSQVIEAYQNPGKHQEAASACLEGIVDGLKQYAAENGVTTFAHWFTSWNDEVSYKRNVIDDLTVETLFQQEPDASSKGSGGMRGTHHARGFTIWDSSAMPFVLDGTTLCIPSLFLTRNNETMDLKIPAKRAEAKLCQSVKRFLEVLHPGKFDFNKVDVGTLAGPEQEYFLLPKKLADSRPDLVACGRALIGRVPARNQQLSDHYFGRIPSDVGPFFEDLNRELKALGVKPAADHGEVAPRQFEVAPGTDEAITAADRNLLVMDSIRRTAERHDMTALLTEKPFAGINGSGKHLNFSFGIIDRATKKPVLNLTKPPKEEAERLPYLLLLSATLVAIKRHAPLLRASVASRDNDQRLGGHEAPPAIISVFLGDALNQMIAEELGEAKEEPKARKINLGIEGVPQVDRGDADRNRTSPMAFTGNRFEFRMPGSSSAQFLPLTALFAATGEVLDEVTEKLAKLDGKDRDEAIRETVRSLMKEAEPVLFDGDAYAADWPEEAKRRGLPNAPDAPTAFGAFDSKETKDLLASRGIMSNHELSSFHEFKLSDYTQRVDIEADVMMEMVKTGIRPAAISHQTHLAERVAFLKKGDRRQVKTAKSELEDFGKLISQLDAAMAQVAVNQEKLGQIEDVSKSADFAGHPLATSLEAVRAVVDEMESVLPAKAYPYPTTTNLLTGLSPQA